VRYVHDFNYKLIIGRDDGGWVSILPRADSDVLFLDHQLCIGLIPPTIRAFHRLNISSGFMEGRRLGLND
jgi:hypothetical protein